MSFSRGRWAGLGLIALLAGCGAKAPRPAVVRVALVEPQNQSGDTALDDRAAWLHMALQAPLAGLSDALVLPAATRRDAADLRPQFVLEPTLDARGIAIDVYETATGRNVREIRCAGAACAQEVAQALGVTPRPVVIPEAVVGKLREAGAAADPPAAFAAVAREFPDVLTVYERWAQWLLGRNRVEEARAVYTAAAGRPWPALEKAQVGMTLASIAGDREGRARAMVGLSAAWPANQALRLQAVELLTQTRQYGEAVKLLEAVRESDPANLGALTALAYAKAFAGDGQGAAATAAEAVTASKESAASYDAQGDVFYLLGRMDEAEAAYLKGTARDGAYQQGRLWSKAAEAALLAGQLPRADGYMQKFFAIYQKGVPGAMPLVQGLWLWRTGARTEAVRQAEAHPQVKPLFGFLAAPGAAGPPPAGAVFGVWAQGRVAEAAEMLARYGREQTPLEAGRWAQVEAVARWEAGQHDQACALLGNWGVPPAPEDWVPATVWPRQLAVRASCLEKSDAVRAATLRKVLGAVTPR